MTVIQSTLELPLSLPLTSLINSPSVRGRPLLKRPNERRIEIGGALHAEIRGIGDATRSREEEVGRDRRGSPVGEIDGDAPDGLGVSGGSVERRAGRGWQDMLQDVVVSEQCGQEERPG